jgi:hypothetical protein
VRARGPLAHLLRRNPERGVEIRLGHQALESAKQGERSIARHPAPLHRRSGDAPAKEDHPTRSRKRATPSQQQNNSTTRAIRLVGSCRLGRRSNAPVVLLREATRGRSALIKPQYHALGPESAMSVGAPLLYSVLSCKEMSTRAIHGEDLAQTATPRISALGRRRERAYVAAY